MHDAKPGLFVPDALSVFRGVFFKEKVKLRTGWIVLAALNLAVMARVFVHIRHLFRLDHAEIVWYRVMGLGHVPYDDFRYIPVFTGVAFACLQFLPEMRGERFRLSLHLPVPENTLIFAHLISGLCGLAAICLADAGALVWIMQQYFPRETVYVALITAAPWIVAGFTAYLGVTLALLEPSLKLRMGTLILAGALAAPMLHDALPGAFAPSLPILCCVPLLLLLASLLPAYNFRHRRVE
ncbi:MAG: hypothetical protein DELT_00535 [Desulfovibrio sp.]